jgi:predicted RNase H-like nuclease (RuvC/YqgF family)
MGFIKPVIWIGVAGTVAAGTAVAVMGGPRACALFEQTRSKINASIDTRIDDPVALRQQLRELESQYPGRIAEVRGDLAELTSQIGQLEREQKVSARVVELAEADLGEIKSLLAKAETARTENGFALVRVRFGDDSLDLEDAYGKANQISQLRGAYASKTADIEGNLEVLRQQETRLNQILGQLEAERAEFQAQLWQLDRQVDAIARNDRMIEMLENRQEAFEKYDRYGNVTSPDQVQGQIAKILAEQESRLNALSIENVHNDYETQAENELSYQNRIGAEILGRATEERTIELAPAVIEITPDGETREVPAKARPLASNNR